MADVFLGADIDRNKLWLIETLQTTLHDQQEILYRRYEAQDLGPEEYVDAFNSVLDHTFAACEAILGEEDFLKLFGSPRSELAGFIDKDAFLQAHEKRKEQLQVEQP